MFLLALGSGMMISSVVMFTRLLIETKKEHYHITVDDAEELPPFIKNRLKPTKEEPKEEMEKLIDMLNSEMPDLDWSELDKFKK